MSKVTPQGRVIGFCFDKNIANGLYQSLNPQHLASAQIQAGQMSSETPNAQPPTATHPAARQTTVREQRRAKARPVVLSDNESEDDGESQTPTAPTIPSARAAAVPTVAAARSATYGGSAGPVFLDVPVGKGRNAKIKARRSIAIHAAALISEEGEENHGEEVLQEEVDIQGWTEIHPSSALDVQEDKTFYHTAGNGAVLEVIRAGIKSRKLALNEVRAELRQVESRFLSKDRQDKILALFNQKPLPKDYVSVRGNNIRRADMRAQIRKATVRQYEVITDPANYPADPYSGDSSDSENDAPALATAMAPGTNLADRGEAAESSSDNSFTDSEDNARTRGTAMGPVARASNSSPQETLSVRGLFKRQRKNVKVKIEAASPRKRTRVD